MNRCDDHTGPLLATNSEEGYVAGKETAPGSNGGTSEGAAVFMNSSDLMR